MTSSSIIATSPMFNDEQRDERAPLRTVLSIITAGNRTISGAGEGQGDEIDTRALADITGMVEWHVTTLLAQYVTEMKRATRSMKLEQFRRFMRKHNFSDSMIINRLFEVFDVCKAGVITFAELLVGLCFFIPHKKWEKCREDPLFLDYSTRFFDIDGQEKLSKFKLYTVINATFGKKGKGANTTKEAASEAAFEAKRIAQELSDAIWEVVSGAGASVSFGDFQRILSEMAVMRDIIHQIMALQSVEASSSEWITIEEEIMEATREWREWKASGRLFSLDRLTEEFSMTKDKQEQEAIAMQADEIAGTRKGQDGLAASFYVKTLRHIMNERDAVKYIRDECKSVQDALAKSANAENEEDRQQFEEDTKLRLEMNGAILEAFKEAYNIY